MSSLVWEIKQSRQNFRAPTFVIGSDHYIPLIFMLLVTTSALFNLIQLVTTPALFDLIPRVTTPTGYHTRLIWFDPTVLLLFYIFPLEFDLKLQLISINANILHLSHCWQIACLSKLMQLGRRPWQGERTLYATQQSTSISKPTNTCMWICYIYVNIYATAI